MPTPRKVTLGVYDKKESGVRAAGSAASANVIVEFDKDLPKNDVIAAIERAVQTIIEQEYN
jgi:hypothetical protein